MNHDTKYEVSSQADFVCLKGFSVDLAHKGIKITEMKN